MYSGALDSLHVNNMFDLSNDLWLREVAKVV